MTSTKNRDNYEEPDSFSEIDHPRYANYWGDTLHQLYYNTNPKPSHGDGGPAAYKRLRQYAYDAIREDTGLSFSDYGDDAARWMAWLRADDTTDAKDIALRRRLGTEYWRQKYGDTDMV